MLEAFRPGESIIWDWCWQATLFLGLGLGASVALARRPARAHRLLVLAILAALATPVLSQEARRGGWGLLTPRAEGPSALIPTGARTAPDAVEAPVIARVSLPPPALPHAAPHVTSREFANFATASGPAQSASDRYRLPYVRWRILALSGWLILTGLAAVRLVTSLILGLNLVRRARLLNDETLTAAALAAGARLGVIGVPELRVSSRVHCPSIWCWGRLPVIVLPEDAAGCDFDRLGRCVLPRAGALAAPGPLVQPARRGVGLCPALAPARLVCQASPGTAQRAGLRRLGARDWIAEHGLCGVALELGPATTGGDGTGGGLEPRWTVRPRAAYPRRTAHVARWPACAGPA